jgi:hypothetical protein
MPEGRAGLLQQLVEAPADHPRPDLGGASGQIDPQRRRQPFGVQRDAAADGDGSPRPAGAASHRDDGHLALRCEADHRRDLVDVEGPDDDVGSMGKRARSRPEQRGRGAVAR